MTTDAKTKLIPNKFGDAAGEKADGVQPVLL